MPTSHPGKCSKRSGLLTLLLLCTSVTIQTQIAAKSTTIDALLRYAVFFHGQPVRVRGVLLTSDNELWILSAEQRVLVVRDGRSGRSDSGTVECLGTFWDIGRLEPDDPHLTGTDYREISQRLFNKPWPGRGELLTLIADSIEPASAPAVATIRSIALEPTRYVDRRVAVTGRFRGRNLYGDLPESPGKSRWDFVLQSVDASIWVTGVRPRGKDFDLNPDARVDTGHWLYAAGVVRHELGLVWIEADEIQAGRQPEETATLVAVVPKEGPQPEVIFSVPTEDETDVSRDTTVRIQFSRAIDPETLLDRVRASYLVEQSTEPVVSERPPVEFTMSYLDGDRVLIIKFTRRLDGFRAIRIELLAGIAATDGALLKPWTLTFSLGGS